MRKRELVRELLPTVAEMAGQTPEVLLRRHKATRLRLERVEYEQIAKKLGYPSGQAAREDVMAGLRRRAKEHNEDSDVLIVRELAELDEIAVKMRVIMESGGVKLHQGEIVPGVVDHGPAIAAAGRLLDVQARRARLLGLDAAVKVDANVTGEMNVNYTYRGMDPEQV